MTVTASELERLADDILAEDRRRSEDRSIASRQFILSEAQLEARDRHEVLTPHLGTMPNAGIYHRAYNPLFGKRPRGKNSPAPEWDSRVPHLTSTPTGWTAEQWARDPQFADRPHEDHQCHLTAGQRSRIRRALRNASGNKRLLHLTRAVLAEKYGVPIRVVMGLAQ